MKQRHTGDSRPPKRTSAPSLHHCIAISALIGLALAWTGASHIPSAEAQAAPSLKPVAKGDVLARDVSTFTEDLRLTNECVDSGVGKTECLCVTRVLKYELSLREYRAASLIYAAPIKSGERRAKKIDLMSRGYSQTEITAVDSLTRNLTKQADFVSRCSEAAEWFDVSSARAMN